MKTSHRILAMTMGSLGKEKETAVSFCSLLGEEKERSAQKGGGANLTRMKMVNRKRVERQSKSSRRRLSRTKHKIMTAKIR